MKKFLLLLCFCCPLLSCESEAKRAHAKQAAIGEVSMLAGKISQIELKIEHEQNPGKIALLVEEVRSKKAQLEELRHQHKKVLSMEESAAAIEEYQGAYWKGVERARKREEAEGK